jgi:bifunctional non-homologous end joining protein LigD
MRSADIKPTPMRASPQMPSAACSPAPELQSIGLMQPARGGRPFTSSEWSFDLPLQGHRVLAEVDGAGSRLLAPGGLDVSRRFPEVTAALCRLPSGRKVFDAELCVLDACGRNDPQRLHERALSLTPQTAPVTLVLHDLLVLDGLDLRPWPWHARRLQLKRLPLERTAGLRLQRALQNEGEWLYRQALALDLPVLHARRCDAPYVTGRSPAWLAIPCAAPAPALAPAWPA